MGCICKNKNEIKIDSFPFEKEREYNLLKPELNQIILDPSNINRKNENELLELLNKTSNIMIEFERVVNNYKSNNENFNYDMLNGLKNDIKDLKEYKYKLNALIEECKENKNNYNSNSNVNNNQNNNNNYNSNNNLNTNQNNNNTYNSNTNLNINQNNHNNYNSNTNLNTNQNSNNNYNSNSNVNNNQNNNNNYNSNTNLNTNQYNNNTYNSNTNLYTNQYNNNTYNSNTNLNTNQYNNNNYNSNTNLNITGYNNIIKNGHYLTKYKKNKKKNKSQKIYVDNKNTEINLLKNKLPRENELYNYRTKASNFYNKKKGISNYKNITTNNSFDSLDFGDPKDYISCKNYSFKEKLNSFGLFGNKIIEREPDFITNIDCLPFYRILNNCYNQNYEWELIPNEIASNQLKQKVGNCYMVSALESISHIPYLLTYIFGNEFSANQQKFKVNFKQSNGKSEIYFVLNNFPVNEKKN